MKLYKPPKTNYRATTITELLDMAEVSKGGLLFRDDLGQLWKLEKKGYPGEVGELYDVAYKYDSRDGWLKRKLIDLWFWITRR